jgi:hypothetical protein
MAGALVKRKKVRVTIVFFAYLRNKLCKDLGSSFVLAPVDIKMQPGVK